MVLASLRNTVRTVLSVRHADQLSGPNGLTGVVKDRLFGLRLEAWNDYVRSSLHVSYSALGDFCCEALNTDVAPNHLCNTIRHVKEALRGLMSSSNNMSQPSWL